MDPVCSGSGRSMIGERPCGRSHNAFADNEAASAAEELKRAADQIAAGAEEASGAAQESISALKSVGDALVRQLHDGETSRNKAEATQALVAKAMGEINGLVTNVAVAAQRQMASVSMVAELEKQAASIGEIVKAVARIADQTNLLALNAAIEAARAGKHGKGFAVVADEVRTLAETSEKSAKQIQDLVGQIQQEVQIIAEGIGTSAKTIENEVENGKTITAQLEQIRLDTIEIVGAIREIATGAAQSSVAAKQALKGAEDIASAAEEQSSAAEETAKTVEEQAKALAEHIREHRAITGEIEHPFGAPKVLAGIRTDIKLAESFGAGQPIRVYSPRSRAAPKALGSSSMASSEPCPRNA
jgi:methyl-accepting chemotaxis protein